jgi:glutaredoxin 3
MDVTIYTGPHCSACKQAKEFFAQNGVKYSERNIDDPSARDELISKGFRAVPVIQVGSETMVGFNAKRLRVLLGLG